MLQCKYCENLYRKLAKAHIIPRSFYKTFLGSSSGGDVRRSIELKVKENDKKERYWQSGIHDSSMVCEKCEQLFNPFDKHGYEVLSTALSKKMIYYRSDRKPYGYLVKNVDYHKLKLFFLSMLWRAHTSSTYFFSHVDLGSHESVFRSYISKGQAPPSNKYEVVLFHPINQPPGRVILRPRKGKIDGVNVYRFHLPDLFAIIKVDQRPLPKQLQPIVLRETPPHYLIWDDYIDSSERRYIEEMEKLLK